MKNILPLFAYTPTDSHEIRLEKMAAFLVAGSCTLAGIIWAVMYYMIFDWGIISLLPFIFVVVVGTALLISHITKKHLYTIYTQIVCIIYIPAFIQWNIGGVFDSGLVLSWAFVGPMCALMFFSIKESIPWFVLFLVNLVVTVIFDDFFSDYGQHVPENIRSFFFIMNLGFASVVVFLFASYYVNAAVKEQKKATILLETNLQQEIILRESEKLATLGKLSSGVAHGLNNPSSTIQRGVQQLQDNISKMSAALLKLGQINLTDTQLQILEPNISIAKKQYIELDPMDRHDQESEVETILAESGLENAWDLAPVLVSCSMTKNELDILKQNFNENELPVVLDLVAASYMIYNLQQEVHVSSEKIAEIVKAMRSYTYLDQADFKRVDIHEGLEDTLLILASRFSEKTVVYKEYDHNLPEMEVYAGELNQVWTNIIDNALYAMDGQGEITIKTYKEKNWFVVEINDNGPGIPLEMQSKIFDPFFTTKPAGQGTGLGLNVSYNIIVKKHKGLLLVDSVPGKTSFIIKLPLS